MPSASPRSVPWLHLPCPCRTACPCHAPSPCPPPDLRTGAPLKDPAALREAGIDCDLVVARVCEAWAAQILADGLFNADPHAGNLMVQVRAGVALPVLLDFGMTVRLSHRQRLGYARLAHAAHQLDAAAVQRAVRSLGLVNSQSEELPGRDLEFWRFFMRDNTGGRKEARADADKARRSAASNPRLR